MATTPERQQVSSNVFDSLPCLAKRTLKPAYDELDAYLAGDIEDVTDALEWWIENRARLPRLSRMAIDYLSIPGKSSVHSALRY